VKRSLASREHYESDQPEECWKHDCAHQIKHPIRGAGVACEFDVENRFLPPEHRGREQAAIHSRGSPTTKLNPAAIAFCFMPFGARYLNLHQASAIKSPISSAFQTASSHNPSHFMHIHLPFRSWQFTLLTVWNLSGWRGFNGYGFAGARK
jgi:hypothetical protein